MSATATARPHFTLCEGGRFHAGLVRAGLAGGARGRLLLIALVLALGWLPLVVLAAMNGTVGGGADVPLIRDIGVWVRFFLVVPALVLAEPLVDRGLGLAVEQFRRSELVPPEHTLTFEAEVQRSQREATSDTIELIIVGVALLLPHVFRAAPPGWLVGHTAWMGTVVGGLVAPSPAGRWYLALSLPLVEFLMLRWLWRTLVWWRLLWRVSRLPLDLVPAHPDRSGGLAFLGYAPSAFIPIYGALNALAASSVAARITIDGTPLASAKGEIAAFVLLGLALLVVPQFFFLRVQNRVKNRALRHFEAAGAAMARMFEERWTRPHAEGPEALLESNHPGAMADFASTYDRVTAMRPVSLSLQELLRLAIPLALPFAPLLLYEFSVKEILQRVVEMVR